MRTRRLGTVGSLGRVSGGGAAWSPLKLPSVLAYYSAGVGAYSDAGVTLATTGQVALQWNDRSGNGYHLTATNGPTITIGASTYLAFDGTNDAMVNTVIPLVAPVTVAAQIKLVNAGTVFKRVWAANTGSDNSIQWGRDATNNSVGYFRTADASTNYTYTPTNDFLTAFRGISVGYAGFAGTNTIISIPDNIDDVASAGALSTTGFKLNDGMTAFQIKELVIVSGFLSYADTQTLLNYWG